MLKLNFTIYKNQNITIFNQGDFYNIQFNDKRFPLIEQILLSDSEDHSPILKMIKPELIFENEKNLTFQNDRVYYKGDLLPVGVADAIFKGLLDQDNIAKYLYLWEKLKEAVSQDTSEYWKFQANKLFFNIYPFEEYLLCLSNPQATNKIKLDNILYLKKTENRIIAPFFWKKFNLNEIMQGLEISGAKLKKTIKTRMIEGNELDPAILEVVLFLKDKISQDHLIEIISLIPREYLSKINILNHFLEIWAFNGQNYSLNRIKKLLTNTKIHETLILATTLAENNAWVDFIFPDTLDLIELSEFIKQETIKVKLSKYTINYYAQYPNLSEISFIQNPEIELVVPSHGMELLAWGQTMGNCIGGETYMKKAKSGNSLLLGFKINNQLTFTLEIKQRAIKQFEEKRMSGKYFNAYHQIIRDELIRCGIITNRST